MSAWVALAVWVAVVAACVWARRYLGDDDFNDDD